MLTSPQNPGAGTEAEIEAMLSSVPEAAAELPLGDYVGQSQATGPYRMPDGWAGWTEQDVLAELRSLPEEMLARLQQQMVALGLGSNMAPGFIDDKTKTAFQTVLGFSNQRGQHWRETLGELQAQVNAAESALDAEAAALTAPDLYRAPNYESMAEGIKGYMRDTLRRDPTEAELALLGDKLGSLYRQAFDDTVAGNQMVEDNLGAGRIIEGPEQRDPMAEFRAWAENQYADEIDVVEDVDERQQATALTGSIADSLGRLVGGAQ